MAITGFTGDLCVLIFILCSYRAADSYFFRMKLTRDQKSLTMPNGVNYLFHYVIILTIETESYDLIFNLSFSQSIAAATKEPIELLCSNI